MVQVQKCCIKDTTAQQSKCIMFPQKQTYGDPSEQSFFKDTNPLQTKDVNVF